MWVKYTVSWQALKSPCCHSVKTKCIYSLVSEQHFSIKAVLLTGGQDKLKSRSKSEWQRQDRWWLGGVWGRGRECIIMHRAAGSGDGKAAGPRSSPSSAHGIALSAPQETYALNHRQQSWKPSEVNFTLPRWLHSHFRSTKVSHQDWDTSHTHMQIHRHGCEGPLQQALIKSCSWALLLLSPCDWCLASLAVTNTDWSQTLNDFGPNLFKDGSLLCPQQTCVQLANIWAQGVTAECGEIGNWSDNGETVWGWNSGES